MQVVAFALLIGARVTGAIVQLEPQAFRVIREHARAADLVDQQPADREGIVADNFCVQSMPWAAR